MDTITDRKKITNDCVEKWSLVTRAMLKTKKPTFGIVTYDGNNKISQRQYQILAALEFTNINSVSSLSKSMGLSKSTISIILSKLAAAGYIVKERPLDADRRTAIFRTTEKAAKIIREQAEKNIEDLRKFYYNTISEENREKFRRGISLLKEISGNNSVSTEAAVQKYIHKDDYDSDFVEILDDVSFFLVNVANTSSTLPAKKLAMLTNAFSQITTHQFSLLFMICKMNLNTISKLQEFTGSSGSTLSITVSKLVDMGLLRKEYPPSGEDGRMVYILPTEKSDEIFKKIDISAKKIVKEMLDEQFSDSQLLKFSIAMDCLLDVFNKK